ncbi:MAG TPA: dTMP kinase [Dictyobacter sp.]|jgi:dTMP kinase|nr:dTMP kinase [Dictyobacter sp.]
MIRGYFISFEGLDGAGKTTQLELLEHWLSERGIEYIRTREPGGTPLGVEIRRLLFQQPELTITPLAEAFLFQADRAQHFSTVVLPALSAGKLVISDRCFDSSIAYQGGARGVGAELVEQLSLLATQQHVPDLTFFLDLDPAQVHVRTDVTHDMSGQREEQSRFDRESEAFHRRLRAAFLALAQAHPERIKVIDAASSPQDIQRQIVRYVEPLLRS